MQLLSLPSHCSPSHCSYIFSGSCPMNFAVAAASCHMPSDTLWLLVTIHFVVFPETSRALSLSISALQQEMTHNPPTILQSFFSLFLFFKHDKSVEAGAVSCCCSLLNGRCSPVKLVCLECAGPVNDGCTMEEKQWQWQLQDAQEQNARLTPMLRMSEVVRTLHEPHLLLQVG